LRFLATEIFDPKQQTADGVLCLLCLQAGSDMQKVKKGPARKESKKAKEARKAEEAAKKARKRLGPYYPPPRRD
jgi:hypothetical protein